MSSQPTTPPRRLTAPDIQRKKGSPPIVALTAYQASLAALADLHVDVLLVGDSLGMVIYGLPDTLGVSVAMMIAHGRAVVKGSQHALVVVDLPFGSYEASPEQAFHTAAMVMRETGCGAVKLEGGQSMAATIRFLIERGIPVMAHIGLTPQAVHRLGGYQSQGQSAAQQAILLADAAAVTAAGAFAIVLEAMIEPLATRITAETAIPTIGIGASTNCDGQILVMDDMLGITPRVPRFVKRYAELGGMANDAIAAYAAEVRDRNFPTSAHLYAQKPAALKG